MRRLLLDKSPLVHTVNRRLRMDLKFRWFGVFGDTASGLLIWTVAADPDMFSTLIAPTIPVETRTAQDARLLTVANGNHVKFLRQRVIVQGPTKTVDEYITVEGVIDEFANKLGGVHVDVNGSQVAVLNRALTEAPDMVFGAVASMGRIIVRALEPLSAKVFDDAQAARRAPGYRVRLHDPDLA